MVPLSGSLSPGEYKTSYLSSLGEMDASLIDCGFTDARGDITMVINLALSNLLRVIVFKDVDAKERRPSLVPLVRLFSPGKQTFVVQFSEKA
jgi:hypothetical protein